MRCNDVQDFVTQVAGSWKHGIIMVYSTCNAAMHISYDVQCLEKISHLCFFYNQKNFVY